MSAGELGDVAAGFIAAELDQERKRRAAVEARGLALVTTSASFSSLLLGVAALVTEVDGYVPSGSLLVFLGAAVLLFSVAGGSGIVAAKSRWYKAATPDTLRALLDRYWDADGVEARFAVSQMNITTLRTLREGSSRAASIVSRGAWAQLAAILFLAVGLAVEVVDGVV